MNGYREDNSSCYFHPREVVVGVCPLCLNERLLVLAAKQGHHSSARVSHRIHGPATKKPPISLPNIFAVGSLLHRLDFRHSKPNPSDEPDTSTSQEDSFISIKFEDNGMASWEKGTVSKVSLEHCSMSWKPTLTKETSKGVIDHPKPQASLRWRKRIGHLFQLIKWKRSNKGTVCHVGTKVEGVKVRKGWMRTFTKRT
ncbi:hypothetical protein SLEP1_g2007 [Rubroshorea leprosula]|uniref:Uncharacterized protein n=1 Tax=Rubroshorea leprosula TaxID=152421 RepID=A0AAV5HMA5_9ROSI|nr:hypothetical protein SLEP1_g2007 [Rubroshorea leprosula]